jgi:hypothetical protein
MKTAIEKLEALFYNEADPTINSSSWVIHERTFKKLILAAKEIEKEQIKKANLDGYKEGCTYHSFDHRPITSEEYYNQTYNQNEI